MGCCILVLRNVSHCRPIGQLRPANLFLGLSRTAKVRARDRKERPGLNLGVTPVLIQSSPMKANSGEQSRRLHLLPGTPTAVPPSHQSSPESVKEKWWEGGQVCGTSSLAFYLSSGTCPWSFGQRRVSRVTFWTELKSLTPQSFLPSKVTDSQQWSPQP